MTNASPTTTADLLERRRRQTAPAVAARKAKALARQIEAAERLLRENGYTVIGHAGPTHD